MPCASRVAAKYRQQLGMLVTREYAIAYFAKTRTSHIFPHIMAFSKLHAQIMLHMQKFTYIHIYAAYFRIRNRIFQHFPCPTLS